MQQLPILRTNNASQDFHLYPTGSWFDGDDM